MISKTISTVGGIGDLPRAQALAASVLGYALFSLPLAFHVLVVVWTLAGGIALVSARHYVLQAGRTDPKEVVTDEFLAAALIGIVFQGQVWQGIGALLLFRILDMYKFGPLRWFDEMKHWSGIFLDDLAAAAGAIVFVLAMASLAHAV